MSTTPSFRRGAVGLVALAAMAVLGLVMGRGSTPDPTLRTDAGFVPWDAAPATTVGARVVDGRDAAASKPTKPITAAPSAAIVGDHERATAAGRWRSIQDLVKRGDVGRARDEAEDLCAVFPDSDEARRAQQLTGVHPRPRR